MDFKEWLVKQVGREQAQYILGDRAIADKVFAVGPVELFIYFVMPVLIFCAVGIIVHFRTRSRLQETHGILAEIVRHKRGEIYDRQFDEEPEESDASETDPWQDMPQDVSILVGEIQ